MFLRLSALQQTGGSWRRPGKDGASIRPSLSGRKHSLTRLCFWIGERRKRGAGSKGSFADDWSRFPSLSLTRQSPRTSPCGGPKRFPSLGPAGSGLLLIPSVSCSGGAGGATVLVPAGVVWLFSDGSLAAREPFIGSFSWGCEGYRNDCESTHIIKELIIWWRS